MQGRLGARGEGEAALGFPQKTQAPESNRPAMGSENSLMRLGRSHERPVKGLFGLQGEDPFSAALPFPLLPPPV